jgi:hypothetical protein
MDDSALQTVERVNVRMAELLEEARRALRGERDFDTEDVRRLREPVGAMESIVARSYELRRLQPEIGGQLDLYKSQLRDLLTIVMQIRVMLTARQAALSSGQTHNTAVSRWFSALNQTR